MSINLPFSHAFLLSSKSVSEISTSTCRSPSTSMSNLSCFFGESSGLGNCQPPQSIRSRTWQYSKWLRRMTSLCTSEQCFRSCFPVSLGSLIVIRNTSTTVAQVTKFPRVSCRCQGCACKVPGIRFADGPQRCHVPCVRRRKCFSRTMPPLPQLVNYATDEPVILPHRR